MRWPDLTKKTFAMLWHLRHWLQYRQLRTWILDNLCYLTINCDTGQHSQFLRCFIQLTLCAGSTLYSLEYVNTWLRSRPGPHSETLHCQVHCSAHYIAILLHCYLHEHYSPLNRSPLLFHSPLKNTKSNRRKRKVLIWYSYHISSKTGVKVSLDLPSLGITGGPPVPDFRQWCPWLLYHSAKSLFEQVDQAAVVADLP